MQLMPVPRLPVWVPEDACRYLEHTEAGRSIRHLARKAGCHPSTVLRQVRRIETRRDDPLVDSALAALAAQHYPGDGEAEPYLRTLPGLDAAEGAFEAKAEEALTWLCQGGAVLAVAEGMEKAVVVRAGTGSGTGARLVVARDLAGAMALQDWIACESPGRLSRYRITAAGRSALSQMLAARENSARQRLEHGFAEAPSGFAGAAGSAGFQKRRQRYGVGETPLSMLARLTGKDGDPFLPPGLVRAGERLREDYELAQVGAHLPQGTGSGGVTPEAAAARDRASRALRALGPGLSDIALRCCCHLEGLEAAERQLGWSARSGKVVLRIALQQLHAHYAGAQLQDGLIG
ncbi:DUF6456 domain-containing protein [Roseobacteraceae bacterium NS-SX3]